jgi:methionyl-tRNA formyltransferase
MRIVFMGTPDFAVESLKILVDNKYDVVGVITMPDKPAGRGHKIQFSPVKQYALDHNLCLLQPEKLKDETFLEKLQSLQADLQIVVAFRMLPEVVWNMPKYGTFNLHASLLPQYRGAAPINWAIINGEKETGATTFFLTHEIDTGKIIEQEKIEISETDNAGTVHDRLMVMGAKLVKKAVDLLIEGKIDAVDQAQFIHSDLELKSAPKIFKETCEIDLLWDVERVYNFVRGMSPYPTAWVELQFPNQAEKLILKVFETEKEFCGQDLPIGTIVTDGKKYAKIALNDGFIQLKSIQTSGKKRMEIGEFLRGIKPPKSPEGGL